MGCGLLLTAVVVGCAGSSDDAVMKEQISLMNEISTIMEKVTDGQSLKDAEKKMENLKKRGQELEAKVKTWSDDKKKAMGQKFEPEIKAASERMGKAMVAAMMKGAGGGLDKLQLPPIP
jgi:hypothetical protein